ncbi:MAG: DUF3124 domain-containing protein [Chitinophagales bacterium]
MKNTILYLTILFFLAQSCVDINPIVDTQEENLINVNHIDTKNIELAYRDTVYIPIYSDIYSKTKDVKFNLTATLSIRNTSLSDTIYIEDIDYYNSHGQMIRQYIDSALFLNPMQSIEYVIEEDDKAGGTGANFIVNWAANSPDLVPMFQGVMISTHGQQGISFLTEGISISKKRVDIKIVE